MRGARPTKSIEEAQRCAEKMGYHWIKILYQRCGSMRSCSGRLLSLPSKSKRSGMRSMRMPLSSTCFLKKLTRCAHSHFPFMCSASSGYGRRTSGHGAGSLSCRRQLQRLSLILLQTIVTLTSTRRNGGMHHSGSTSPCRLKRGMKADEPVKGPVWQKDESEILLSKNGVHAQGKC